MLPFEAVPISAFIIFICSLATFQMGIKDKLENPKSDFINYDYALVFCPCLLLGTKFGTIFNNILSAFIICIFLIVMIIYTFYRIFNSYQKQKKIEEQIDKSVLEPLEKNSNKHIHNDFVIIFL